MNRSITPPIECLSLDIINPKEKPPHDERGPLIWVKATGIFSSAWQVVLSLYQLKSRCLCILEDPEAIPSVPLGVIQALR